MSEGWQLLGRQWSGGDPARSPDRLKSAALAHLGDARAARLRGDAGDAERSLRRATTATAGAMSAMGVRHSGPMPWRGNSNHMHGDTRNDRRLP